MDNMVIKTNIENYLWSEIQKEYGNSKKQFGEQIRFVKEGFKRKIIFRDVAHAYGCLKQEYYKPAVILAGGVIEEMLRLYLEHKGYNINTERFYDYIEKCKKKKLLKSAITHLSVAVKDFRNFVHLKEESSDRYTISRPTALGAVSAIFTIANEFQ